MSAGMCTFPRLPCPCTKRHVMLYPTSTGVQYWYLSTVCVYLASLINMVVDVVVQNPQKSNEYEYEKRHVRRVSKMCCCCCCRFCCGAPTTDERIHAPVLPDASQISYCRYWGRASLPPITSITINWSWLNQERKSWLINHDYLIVYREVDGVTIPG